MSNQIILEICVESVDLAVAAERGGADRIEICSDLSSGGITPSAGLLEAARHHISLPLHVLIRPRSGNFLYSDYEFEIMSRDIRMAQQLRLDGVVLGLLDERGEVDISRTACLVDLARPLPVTFHRAFDLCENQMSSLEAVVQTGAQRILTSGGQTSVADNLGALARLIQAAGDRIVVMPGGGVDLSNLALILRQTSAREIHTSLGMSNAGTEVSNHAASGRGSKHTLGSTSSPTSGSTAGSTSAALSIPNGSTTEFESRVREVRELLLSL